MLKPFEEYHLKLVRLRLKERGRADVLDDLFGVKYAGEPGEMAEVERKKLPDNAVAVVEQLALWLPADGRLLWQLGRTGQCAWRRRAPRPRSSRGA